MSKVYVIGSLRNPAIPQVAEMLRSLGHEVFDDWYAAGPEADDYWQKYERAKGSSFAEALAGFAAHHVFAFDKKHLDACDIAVMVMPAGKSAHLELGYCKGLGKQTVIFMDKEPERFDVMYNFADKVCTSDEELIQYLSHGQPQFEDTAFGKLNPWPFPLPTPRDTFYSKADADNVAAPVPAGMALVPLRMTQAMRDATDSDEWDWPGLLAAAESITEEQHAELSAAATIAPELDVTKILLNVVPGDDGEGLEVYANSTDEVVALLTQQAELIEDLQSRLAAPVAPAPKSCATCKGCDGAYAPASFGRDCTGYQRELG